MMYKQLSLWGIRCAVCSIFLICTIFGFTPTVLAGSLWLIADGPHTAPQSGAVFETELQFSSWEYTIGAYKIAVSYDPTVLRILNVAAPTESEFIDNTFADEDSFESGTTHIAAFQVQSQDHKDEPTAFAIIQWEAIGGAGSSSDIEIEALNLVDPYWRSPDVIHLIPTTIVVVAATDSDNDGLPDDIENEPDSCTDPYDADSDEDGILDGDEDADHDGDVDPDETNPCLIDSDGDGIQDGTEIGLTLADVGPDTNTNLFQPDLDPTTFTDPLNPDTDGDGREDGQEDANRNGRFDTGETDPNSFNPRALPWLPLLLLTE